MWWNDYQAFEMSKIIKAEGYMPEEEEAWLKRRHSGNAVEDQNSIVTGNYVEPQKFPSLYNIDGGDSSD